MTTLRLMVHAASDVGCVRTENQDAVGVNGTVLQGQRVEPQTILLDVQSRQRIAVCDGMGGHNAGALAARMAAAITTSPDRSDGEQAIHTAHVEIQTLGRSDTNLAGLGTTAVVLEAFPDGSAFIRHVGDSRAYLLDDALRPLTRDDRLDPSSSVLLQALGGGARHRPEVHSLPLELLGGQRYLLCSDGIPDSLGPEAIVAALRTDTTAGALVDAAVSAGAQDNATAVVVDVVSSPIEPLPPELIELGSVTARSGRS